MAKQRIRITNNEPPAYTRRSYYDMTPLQQIDADRLITPIARENHISSQTMARCVNEWLVAGWGSTADPVIGWVHPTRGTLLFSAR